MNALINLNKKCCNGVPQAPNMDINFNMCDFNCPEIREQTRYASKLVDKYLMENYDNIIMHIILRSNEVKRILLIHSSDNGILCKNCGLLVIILQIPDI